MTIWPSTHTLRRLLGPAILALLSLPVSAMNDGAAGPWAGFPRTRPTTRYESDPGADPGYHFGVTKAFSPYQDPDKAVAQRLPSPLDDPDFSSYNLIVVISKTDDNPDDDHFWGPQQTLRVYQRGKGLIYYWLVSTGMPGHETASGYFTPKAFSSRHWSSEYDAPMLWAVFFHGGAALHSSLDRGSIADMGKAAESHGCVHEEDYRAEEMFHLVGRSGYGLVDQISERTGRPTGRQVSGYKTLIIVGPTTRWDNGQPQPLNATLKWEDPATAGSPDTAADGDYSSSSAGATQVAPAGKSDDY